MSGKNMTHTITAAAYHGDIVSRLRNWRGLHLAHSGRLFEEAADAIERARGDAAVARLRLDAAHAEIERLRTSDRSQAVKPAEAKDAGSRLRQMNDVLEENDRLREAIRRLAEQDATLSVQGGSVAVTMDATLTDAEREAIEAADAYMSAAGCHDTNVQRTLRGLLERLK